MGSNFTRLASPFDLRLIREELARRPEDWLHCTTRQQALKVHRHTQAIELLVNEGVDKTGAHSYKCHNVRPSDLAEHYPSTLKMLYQFAEQQDAILGRVAFTRLAPQAEIGAHYDRGEYYWIRDRYHLVIDSFGSFLEAGRDRQFMVDTEFWVFNNKLTHRGHNPTDQWRVHLIFDLYPLVGGHYVYPLDNYSTDYAQWIVDQDPLPS